jgi:hypothetical protein
VSDDQARAELARDIEMEQHFERQALAERYFALGINAGLLQALDDAVKCRTWNATVESIMARLAPTVGRDQ